MANFTELLFLIFFLLALVITIIKAYNVFFGLRLYKGWKNSLSILIVYIIIFGILFFISMAAWSVIYTLLFNLVTFFLSLNTVFTIIEIILSFGSKKMYQEPYFSNKENKK